MLLTFSFINIPTTQNHTVKAQAIPQTIDEVTVSLKTNAPPRAAQRMISSIKTVGEQILLGRSFAEVAQNKDSYERLIKEIFDKVLVGYSVSRVEITLLATAHIDVAITPWNDVVDNVAVEIDFGTLPPEITKLIEGDIGDVESLVNEILIGLPVEAVDWAGVITKNGLREYFADRLPEFRPAFDITAGQKTVFKITLTPNSPIIQDTNVVIKSHTIPNILLSGLKAGMEELAGEIRGLPVAFVDRHQNYFAKNLKSGAENYYLAKKYGLNVEPYLAPGVISEIRIGVETVKYKINIEGYLDIRHDEGNNENTSAKIHLGRMFGAKNTKELFLETTFIPSTVRAYFEPGLAMAITPTSVLDVRYSLSENYYKIRLNQEINPRISLRVERTLSEKYNEFGIRYKVHEMLSVEYIFGSNENWLRLIGRL